MTAVVVGASTGLGRALARTLAERGHDLVLVATDPRDLSALASDLQVRHGIVAQVLACNVRDHQRCVALLEEALGNDALTAMLLPVGRSSAEDDLSINAAEIDDLMGVNATGVMAIAAWAGRRMETAGAGSIIAFSSVAALRGRSKNMVYAAAKQALITYFEALRHRLQAKGVTVTVYIVGYIDTNLAYGQRLPFPRARPEQLAVYICDHLHRSPGTHFLPRWWGAIGLVLRHVPFSVYQRLDT